MSNEKETEKNVGVAKQKFSKKALLSSAEFIRFRDLLKVLLKDSELYTIEEAREKVNSYLNKEV